MVSRNAPIGQQIIIELMQRGDIGGALEQLRQLQSAMDKVNASAATSAAGAPITPRLS